MSTTEEIRQQLISYGNAGWDLSKEHIIIFYIAMANEQLELQLVSLIQNLGYKALVDLEEQGGRPLCFCSHRAIPSLDLLYTMQLEIKQVLESIEDVYLEGFWLER